MSLRSVFFYISGHGFGHASRQIEIINTFGASAPGVPIVVRTSAPKWLFDRTARVPITVASAECDTGVVQIDSLRLDEKATIERAGQFHDALEQRIADEVHLLRRHDAGLVICDAPPLACAAASRAGAPAVVVANFTWDWIYEAYSEHLDKAPRLLPSIRNAYRTATAAWRLPMHGGFDTFSTIIDVPFVARHARHAPSDVRRALSLPALKPLVLISFGGFGANSVELSRVDCLDDLGVVLTHGPDQSPPRMRGVHAVNEAVLYQRGLRYEDLVGAVDVVLTKPGYGIISECIANDTAILYTSRGRFAEYDVLVSEMPRYLRSGFIAQDDLFEGRWRQALERVMAAAAPPEEAGTNGAEVVARMIHGHLTRR